MTTTGAPVEVGLLLFTLRHSGKGDATVLTELTETVIAAEDAGWDAAWVTEHHFQRGLVNSSALTTASWLLGWTQRMRIGTAITVLPIRHPVMVAEEALVLHHLSGGRFSLGVGRGGPVAEQLVFAGGLTRWREGFRHDLATLGQALAGSVTLPSLDMPLQMAPSPGHLPGPEVLVAANSTASVDAAAEKGLPLLLAPTSPISVLRALLDRYEMTCRARGVDPSGVAHVASAVVHVANSPEQAFSQLRAAWVPWFVEALRSAPYLDLSQRPQFTDDDFAGMLAFQPLGTAEDVMNGLRERTRALGVRRFSLIADATGDPHLTRRTVEEIGRRLPSPPGTFLAE